MKAQMPCTLWCALMIHEILTHVIRTEHPLNSQLQLCAVVQAAAAQHSGPVTAGDGACQPSSGPAGSATASRRDALTNATVPTSVLSSDHLR